MDNKALENKINEMIGKGWELVDAVPTSVVGKPNLTPIKVFKKTVLLSLQNVMNVEDCTSYTEVEVDDENQQVIKFPDRN